MEKSRENYLRVTSVLYPFSGLQKIDPNVVAYAADRGTRVHKICEAVVKGLGDVDNDLETWGYVESFRRWWGEGKPLVEMERRFWCDDYEITGQVDMIIDTPEGLALVDLKTSSRPSKTWAMQGSGYYYLAKRAGLDIKKILFVHLNKHGKEPDVIEYDPDVDFFLAILRVYKHFFGGK